MTSGSILAHSLFLSIKFYWHSTNPFMYYLCCFCFFRVESLQQRYMAHYAETTYHLAHYRKNLLTSNLGQSLYIIGLGFIQTTGLFC